MSAQEWLLAGIVFLPPARRVLVGGRRMWSRGPRPGPHLTRYVTHADFVNARTRERRRGLYLHAVDQSRYPAGFNKPGMRRLRP